MLVVGITQQTPQTETYNIPTRYARSWKIWGLYLCGSHGIFSKTLLASARLESPSLSSLISHASIKALTQLQFRHFHKRMLQLSIHWFSIAIKSGRNGNPLTESPSRRKSCIYSELEVLRTTTSSKPIFANDVKDFICVEWLAEF